LALRGYSRVLFSLMPYAAILFDMDGTLIETNPLWAEATRLALEEYNIQLTDAEKRSLAGVLLHDLLHKKGYDADTIKAVRGVRDAAMQRIIPKGAQWIDGAYDLLQTIKAPKGIVTSAHLNVFEHMDAALGLTDLVQAVVLADDVRPDYKPHPKGLLIACERLGVDPAECVYIGDQECDLQAAAAAGMDSILIRGTHTPADLTHTKMVADIDELAKLLATPSA
jgi:HAD superfamily hydrolase (TIGR01509 family)